MVLWSHRCFKFSLFDIIHFMILFQILALGLLAFGALCVHATQDNTDFEGSDKQYTTAIVACGIILFVGLMHFIMSAVGLHGALKENKNCLKTVNTKDISRVDI